MKSKKAILKHKAKTIGSYDGEDAYTETQAMAAMEEYHNQFATQSPPIQEGESVWVEVPVSERLPEVSMHCFVFTKREDGSTYYKQATYFGNFKGWAGDFYNDESVTHWLERRTPQESKEGVEDWISVEKGKYVKRSTYQKLAEENKKLLIDIGILTDEKYSLSAEKLHVVVKWRNKFAKDKEFNRMLTEACKQYLKEHPEFDITSKDFKPPKQPKQPLPSPTKV